MEAHSRVAEQATERLRTRLVELLNGLSGDRRARMSPQVLKERLRQEVRALPVQDFRALQISREGEEDRFLQKLIDETLGTSPLDRLLVDPTITEIMVNGPNEVFVEREGHLERTEVQFRDTEHLMAVIERLLGTAGLSVNESNQVCDAILPDGSRINVIIPPLALNGPVVTIRRKLREWTMSDYVKTLALSEQAGVFLEACVKAKVNCIVSGGTSTGKTTLVSILSAFIPPHERIITIENVAELTLRNRDHWIQLVAKAPNLEGRGEIPLRALVRNALRMRPDRIILGEARGGEALDVVQAMHIGHEGVITVLHANSPQAALQRLETLMLMSGLDLPPQACRMQIASVVDLVIHMGRFADGSRRIAAIAQVLGASEEGFELEDLFVFDVEGFAKDGRMRGTFRYTEVRPKFLHKFQLNNVPIPSWIVS